MVSNFSSFLSRICAAFITLLGFGCSSDEPGDESGLICMYGCPTGTFEIKGKVSDGNENKPVEAVIKVTEPACNSGALYFTSVQTGVSGKYEATLSGFVFDEVKVVCLPIDTRFEADSTFVSLDYIKQSDDHNVWSLGTAKATINFNLKEKPDDQ